MKIMFKGSVHILADLPIIIIPLVHEVRTIKCIFFICAFLYDLITCAQVFFELFFFLWGTTKSFVSTVYHWTAVSASIPKQ